MDAADPPTATLQIRRGAGGGVSRERIRLLKAIGAEGTISGGAKSVGLNFRAAWDAVQALNNLFPEPLVSSRAGGAKGGEARLTPFGLAVIAGYEKLDTELNALMERLEGRARGDGGSEDSQIVWSLGMRTSARNALRGRVETVTDGAVNCEVTLRVGPSTLITAVITRSSVEELDLRPGRDAVVLIKASFIILAPAEPRLRTSARNQIEGVVIRHERGAVNDEVVVEIDEGKTLAAVVTRASVEDLKLSVGSRVCALIKASQVIVAVD